MATFSVKMPDWIVQFRHVFVFTTSDDHGLTAPTSANTPHTDLQR